MKKEQIPQFVLTIWLKGFEKNPITTVIAAEEIGEHFGNYLHSDKCLTFWGLDKPGVATVVHGHDILRMDIQLLERSHG